jgi:transposase
MSGKEAPRPGLVRSVSAGLITNRQAAEALGLTLRHVQRLKARFRADGVGGLVHRGRGQPSPRRLADPVRAQITHLMTTVYERVNDVHLTEKLREVHGLPVSRSTVRRLRLGSIAPRCAGAGPRAIAPGAPANWPPAAWSSSMAAPSPGSKPAAPPRRSERLQGHRERQSPSPALRAQAPPVTTSVCPLTKSLSGLQKR